MGPTLSLPSIGISKSKCTQDSDKYSTLDTAIGLGYNLKLVRQNKSIYLKPLDAWHDEQTASVFSYSSFGSYRSIAIPIVVVIITVVIVKIYRRPAQLEFVIRHLLQGKGSEIIALSTLVNKAEAFEPDNSTHALVFGGHFMIILWMILIVLSHGLVCVVQ